MARAPRTAGRLCGDLTEEGGDLVALVVPGLLQLVGHPPRCREERRDLAAGRDVGAEAGDVVRVDADLGDLLRREVLDGLHGLLGAVAELEHPGQVLGGDGRRVDAARVDVHVAEDGVRGARHGDTSWDG